MVRLSLAPFQLTPTLTLALRACILLRRRRPQQQQDRPRVALFPKSKLNVGGGSFFSRLARDLFRAREVLARMACNELTSIVCCTSSRYIYILWGEPARFLAAVVCGGPCASCRRDERDYNIQHTVAHYCKTNHSQ